MIINNGTLEGLVSRFVGRKTVDEVSQNSFSTVAAAESLVPAVTPVTARADSSASQDSTKSNNGYDESFARMMFNIKTLAEKTLSEATADSDNGFIASTGSTSAINTDTPTGSVQQEFMDYMKQSAEEKMREKLTGVSKEEYDAMTPEEKLALDKKVQEALKEQQTAAVDDINARINGIKAGMVA
ncbi:hypothetical protein Q6A51_02095 [Pseudomonas sp. KFB-139]|uniref:Uncharacterized protein n=1 Tax=Pseudomonas serbiensis TaxID=3064350 RepID=A0ABT9CN58_9PSED|nr:hypothetical protein [Pseudomonas sp. KFB-138]MDO7925551.1 hypothetical protein [Pseudomonas sp. KFB-138]